jgi:hypothetical protein
MRRILPILLLIAPTLHAAEPKAALQGPAVVKAGQPIWLDASASKSDVPLTWQVEGPPTPLLKLTADGGPPASFGFLPNPPAGKYTIIVIALGTPDGGAKPVPHAATLTVVVEGLQPPPGPPTPEPDGDPDIVILKQVGVPTPLRTAVPTERTLTGAFCFDRYASSLPVLALQTDSGVSETVKAANAVLRSYDVSQAEVVAQLKTYRLDAWLATYPAPAIFWIDSTSHAVVGITKSPTPAKVATTLKKLRGQK